MQGFSGEGITINIYEGSAINIHAAGDFERGHVLAGSFNATTPSHAHRVGQQAAGSFDGPVVGVAYGANTIWMDAQTNRDVANWSISLGNTHITGQWNGVDVAQRSGLGNVWVLAAGNHGGTMLSLLTSTKNPTGMVVGSIVDATGEWASFSESGAALWVVHPGFGGTSWASPGVSGVAALMLQANAGLGNRDVKNIIALSASYFTTATPLSTFELNHARALNGAGAHYSNTMGFGVINAYNATRLAADWLADGSAPKVMVGWQHNSATVATTALPIAAQAHQVTTVSIQVSQDVKLEALQVSNFISSDSFSKMRIQVTSPSGTVSELCNGTTVSTYNSNLLMTSNKFWGESSKGTWTVSYEFTDDARSNGSVSQVSLSLFGSLNEVDDKYVYTDQYALHWQLADAHARSQMGWLSDLNGGHDSLMASAMNTAVQVHLGRQGWMSSSAFAVAMSPGTRIENALGGDGDDVLVGLRDGKSILRGNAGNDVLMGYGAGSVLDGGNADDWLWVGANTTAVGGQGNDRFMVFQGESSLTSTAAVKAKLLDFDTAIDRLFVYDAAGHFKLAQFDAAGDLSGWTGVQNASLVQTLRGQLAQSDAPDVMGVVVSGSPTSPTLSVQWDQDLVHPSSSFVTGLLNGASPMACTLSGQSWSLTYSGLSVTGPRVLDLSGSELYSSLGVKQPYQQIWVGSTGADTLDASGQSGAVALLGQGGGDVLLGGAGDDVLVATTGAQARMRGGQGADVFRLQLGSLTGRLEVTDFSAVEGDRLDLDDLLKTIGVANFVEDCVKLSRVGDDAQLRFDLSGRQAFDSSGFELSLDGFYAQSGVADWTLKSLLYGAALQTFQAL